MRTRWITLCSILLIGALTAALGYTIWHHLEAYLDNDQRVVRSREALQNLDELIIALADVELSARGFLLTEDPRSLANYDAGDARLDARFAAAAAALEAASDRAALDEANVLIARRRAVVRYAVARASGGNGEAALAAVRDGDGRALAAAIRERLLGLRGDVVGELEARLSACRSSMLDMTRWTRRGLAALAAVSVTALLLLWHEEHSRRRTAAALARARDAAEAGNRAKEEFLGVVSHELREPLTPALLAVTGLERACAADTVAREDLAMIRQQLELEGRLIDDLLDVSRVLRGTVHLRRGEVAVHRVLGNVLQSFAGRVAEKELTLAQAFDARDDRVSGDESRLRQVFWNLMSNAVKFTPSGGSVSVRTADAAGGRLTVEFTDSGVGIAADRLAAIFEPLRQADSSRTRQFGGMGVGLTIARAVVELHGGSLRAASPGPGRGATFVVELPLATGARRDGKGSIPTDAEPAEAHT